MVLESEWVASGGACSSSSSSIVGREPLQQWAQGDDDDDDDEYSSCGQLDLSTEKEKRKRGGMEKTDLKKQKQ